MDDVSTSDGRVSDAAQQFAAPEALRWERPASLTTRDRALTRLTRGQRGHVTFGQLIELGFSRSWWQARVRSGTLVKVHRNVVRLGSVPATEEGAVVAACLAIPGPAYASQTTAAALWRLGDLRLGGTIHVTVPVRSRRALAGVTIHVATHLRSFDTVMLDGIPIIAASRTVFDASGEVDADTAEDVVLDAIRLGRVTERDLWSTAAHVGNLRGSRAVHRSLTRFEPDQVRRLLSWLERRMYTLCQREGLPLPRVNVRLHTADGTLVGVVDLRWPGVVAEVDGLRFHSTRRQKEHDDARQNAIVLKGELVLRYSDGDVRNEPDRVSREIRRALELASELGLDRRENCRG